MKRSVLFIIMVFIFGWSSLNLQAGTGDLLIEGKAVTGKLEIGEGTIEIPNSISLPATCTVGELYMDTDATSGQRCYLCESTDTWVLQGDGGGGGSAFKTHNTPQGTNPVADSSTDTLLWLEGEGIDITGDSVADSITVKGEDASTINKGIASFSSSHFTVFGGGVALTNDGITENKLKCINAPTDEYFLTYESTTGDFEWQVGGGGGVSDAAYDASWDGVTTIAPSKNAVYDKMNTAGSAAVRDAEDTLTDGSNLPDGAAIKTYGDANWGGGSDFVNASDYTGTDRAKIQAAITEAQTNGGIVYIPGKAGSGAGGVWVVDDHDSDGHCLEVTDSITIMGDGKYSTKIYTTSTTANVFYINTHRTVIMRDMQIYRNCTPSAGAGIYLTYTTTGYTNKWSIIENIDFMYHYDGINTDRAWGWKVEGCTFYGNTHYGIRVRDTYEPDAGDSMIVSCLFQQSSGVGAAHVRQESAGGLKIVNSKFLGAIYGYDMYITTGNVTSILLITGTSIENQSAHSVRLTQAGTGYFGQISLTGNQFRKGIEINAATDASLREISITGNVIHAWDDDGIELNGGDHINIDGNVFRKSTGGLYAIQNTGATNVLIGDNLYNGFGSTDRFSGTFVSPYNPKGPRIQDTTPSFWLDETDGGVKGTNIVLDAGIFQIQRRATNFGAYEATPLQINMTTGNLTVLGTASASCGTLTCDYVFEDGYELMALDELQEFVAVEKQLPNMSINEGGSYSTATLREELVEKIEEQALYILQLHERLKIVEQLLN